MAEEKKHFDVAHPGTTTPQHTSRPIIVSRSNVVGDPMVKQDTEQPVGEPQDKKSTLSHASLGLTTPAVKDTSKDTDTEKNAEDKPIDATPRDNEASNEVSAESITSNTKTPNQASIVPDKVEELIQSKAYELPISRPKSKAVMLPVFVLLMIVLVGAVVYIAMLATGRL